MSGHSKWSTIKRQKGVADAKRSSVFTKLGKAIVVAARLGGADPAMNFRLRLAVEKAREASMPKDNIERAIAKGSGTAEGQQLEEVTYEGFGPGGTAIIVEAVTDNRNRTVHEVKTLFSKHGGTMGNENSVRWQFDRRGVLRIAAEHLPKDHDTFALQMIEEGAEDVKDDPEGITLLTQPEALEKVKVALGTTPVASADIEFVPKTPLPLSPADAEKLHTLTGILEDHADVTNVWTNGA
ncbi:MAG: YebC/PmpR family DNA-binding transcriptional regulator [Patescibacteria group bacterium]|jgi:YebC/PmpR family DNA-binding regulatory protein